jgi:hypothetical protein
VFLRSFTGVVFLRLFLGIVFKEIPRHPNNLKEALLDLKLVKSQLLKGVQFFVLKPCYEIDFQYQLWLVEASS